MDICRSPSEVRTDEFRPTLLQLTSLSNTLSPDGSPWQPRKGTLICSRHFVDNAVSTVESHPSYIPTVFPPVYRKKAPDGERHKRYVERDIVVLRFSTKQLGWSATNWCLVSDVIFTTYPTDLGLKRAYIHFVIVLGTLNTATFCKANAPVIMLAGGQKGRKPQKLLPQTSASRHVATTIPMPTTPCKQRI